jgi:hypothetical protein
MPAPGKPPPRTKIKFEKLLQRKFSSMGLTKGEFFDFTREMTKRRAKELAKARAAQEDLSCGQPVHLTPNPDCRRSWRVRVASSSLAPSPMKKPRMRHPLPGHSPRGVPLDLSFLTLLGP